MTEFEGCQGNKWPYILMISDNDLNGNTRLLQEFAVNSLDINGIKPYCFALSGSLELIYGADNLIFYI